MKITNAPVAKAELRIRKPVADVFEAFVSPDIITQFWFDRSTGRMAQDATVQWHWDSCNMTVEIRVIEMEPNQCIRIEWSAKGELPSIVQWKFTSESANETFVIITNHSFSGDGDEVVAKAIDSAGGFNLVLAAVKAYLEHGIRLNIVEDHFPKRE